MLLPSLHASGDNSRQWNVVRAAACGAGLGACAALVKTLAVAHQPIAASIPEALGAALGFALLCAGAAGLRNFIARRLV